MLYVERVVSSLKKGCDVTLGPRTVIVGPNGAGKSTIVQSIELAANGWVSDMEGRSRVKLHTALARLFPEDVRRFSSVVLSDGTKLEWQLEDGGKPGTFKKPDHNPSVVVRWPFQDLSDVLKGDANTVAAWLEQQVIGELKESELISALPPAVRDITRDFVKKQRKFDFIALAKDAKNESKNLKTQATRMEKTIESMTEGIAPPLDDEARIELENKLNEFTSPKPGVSQETFNNAKAVVEGITEDLSRAKAELVKLPTLPDTMAEVVKRVTLAQGMLKGHAEHLPMDDCWICGNDKPDFVGQAQKLAEARAKIAKFVEIAEKQQELVVEIGNIEEKLNVNKTIFNSMVVAESVNDHERRLVMSRIAADDAARKTWANAEATTKEADQLRSRADLLSLAGAALEKAGKQYLDKRKSDFEAKVSSYLPEGERIGVDLDSSRFGLIRDGELHSALSGAEWSRVLLALASAQDEGSSTPSLLVPEDRAWDPDTLSRVMKALSTSPVQVIIMSTVAPSVVEEGWTCINL